MNVGSVASTTRTETELSVVCAESSVPRNIEAEHGWRVLRVAGPLEFDLTGILASLLSTLAESGIAVFALSTFDTDYVFVKNDAIEAAVKVLEAAGQTVARGA